MEQRKQLAAQNWYMLYNFKSAAHTYSKAKNAQLRCNKLMIQQ